jgi:hypothetical protein
VELFPPTEELQPLMKTVTPSKSAEARTRPRSRTFTGGTSLRRGNRSREEDGT